MAAFVVAIVAMPVATTAIAAVYLRQYAMSRTWRPVAVAVHFLAVSTIICAYAMLCVFEYRATRWSYAGWAVFAAGSAVFWYSVHCHPTCLVPDEDCGVVSKGPYRHVRHPIYASGLLAALGLLAVAPSLRVLAVWLVLAASMVVLLALEERELLARFGRAYAEYRRRTGLLIPGIF